MKTREDAGARHRTDAEERRSREIGLDKTIEASFPASDPPSTNPNPHAPDEEPAPRRGDTASKR